MDLDGSDSDSDRITVLASSRAVVAGRVGPATIVMSDRTGKIIRVSEGVLPASSFPAATVYRDHSPHVLLPGLVDAHVHLNEPGRTEWEGFGTGTWAAAAGGVTTLVDMPLNAIPPTTTVAALHEKVAAARGQCWVDVGFYGGVVPGNEGELKELVKQGVCGFKGFLIDSGVEEFPAVDAGDIAKAMAELKDEPTVLMFHAEMVPPEPVGDDEAVQTPKGSGNAYDAFLASRPPSFETRAISEVLSLASIAPDLPLHIVHLSTVEAIPLLRRARRAGVKITAETCFHYLSLAAEDIPDGDTRHKCCPPIRGQANLEGLWEEVLSSRGEEDGVIQTIVSDHSPCTPNLKLLPTSMMSSRTSSSSSSLPPAKPSHHNNNDDDDDDDPKTGDFFSAWGGISSVGLGLSILWTAGRPRGLTLPDVARLCSQNTARHAGLDHRKGRLAPGLDADVIVFDDRAAFVVGPDHLRFRHPCSPYEGRRLTGLVQETWLRGKRVFSKTDGWGRGLVDGPSGILLLDPRRREK